MTHDSTFSHGINDHTLTTMEVSYLFDINPRTVRDWISRKWLIAFKPNREWRITGVSYQMSKKRKACHRVYDILKRQILREDHAEKISTLGYGLAVDLSEYIKPQNDNSHEIIDIGERLVRRDYSEIQRINLLYYLSRAYDNRVVVNYTEDSMWAWDMPNMDKQIIYLRKALLSPAFEEMPPSRKGQVLVNLGNRLSTLGRTFEAIEHWNMAIKYVPGFPMAIGNRGYAYYYLAKWGLYSRNIQAEYFRHAWSNLVHALNNYEYLEPDAASGFDKCKREIEQILKPEYLKEQTQTITEDELGTSEDEIVYRQWCVQHKLVLNPRVDLGSVTGCSNDTLHLPGFFVGAGKETIAFGLFNQIKQEYVTARFLGYSGISRKSTHYSDYGTILIDTADSAYYCYAVEMLKISFRMAYSILDKIAYFINAYFKLKKDPQNIGLRTIWYQSNSHEILPLFPESKNWPLRGLFWLSKDLYEEKCEYRNAIEPSARDIWHFRNHLEHKYVRICNPKNKCKTVNTHISDQIAYEMSRTELEQITISLLKLVRSALLYLLLAVRWEERKQTGMLPKDSKIRKMKVSKVKNEYRK